VVKFIQVVISHRSRGLRQVFANQLCKLVSAVEAQHTHVTNQRINSRANDPFLFLHPPVSRFTPVENAKMVSLDVQDGVSTVSRHPHSPPIFPPLSRSRREGVDDTVPQIVPLSPFLILSLYSVASKFPDPSRRHGHLKQHIVIE
jgi:hypothetical protein